MAVSPDGVIWDGMRLPGLGRHQARNAALAAALCADLPHDAVRRGIEATELPACCELFRGSPPLLIDGAHNLSSVRALLGVLRDHLPGRRPVLVFALSQDKDAGAIARELAPAAARV
ncbi:MAG: glutamate ligase domain-containing protein, partial [Planctomycetota bacterium]